MEISPEILDALYAIQRRMNSYAGAKTYTFSIQIFAEGSGYIRAQNTMQEFIVPDVSQERDETNVDKATEPFLFIGSDGLAPALLNAQKWSELVISKTEKIMEQMQKDFEKQKLIKNINVN